VNKLPKTYKPYKSYKPSDEDWIGDIPSHWRVIKGKYLFSEVNERSQTGEEDLLSVSQYTGVTMRKDKFSTGEQITNARSLIDYKKTEKGDLVSNIMLAWNGSLGVSPYSGIVSPAYSVYRFRDKCFGSYFHYLLRTDLYKATFKKNSSGIMDSRLRLYTEDFFDIMKVLPPIEEQEAIAKFLDDQTEKIERAIAIKETQIELLKERKQILIQNAVTRGLNPDAPMKDSGVDWIGEIPAHWDVEKLFGLCRFVRGNSAFAKDELLNKGKYVALQYGKIYKVDEVDEAYQFYVNEEFYKASQVVNFGDVIFISTSETIEDLGHSAIYNREELGLIGGEQLLIKPNKDFLDCHYAYYSTKVFSKVLRKYATGIKVFRFNINDLKTIYTVVPPKEEQRKIAQHLSAQSAKIDETRSLLENQITHLREYRASLINAAVTGKIKVPA
jgi:type I restriction enzyme S subunit